MSWWVELAVDFKKVIDEHLRFARKAGSHVSLQILLTDLLENLFNIGLEDILLGLEKGVKSKVKGIRGKTDLLFQNIVFEVKVNLNRELEDGKKQLKKYFQALHESDPESKNIGLITDCINFMQYAPIIRDGEVKRIREISSIDLEKKNYKDAILWLDAILFSKTQIAPSAEDLKFRFGLGSPTYTYILQEMEKAWDKIEERESMKLKLKLWNRHMEIVYGRLPTIRGFLEQTFLVILVKLIVYLRIHGLDNLVGLDVYKALTGRYFRVFGISNLVEEGYYSWILDEKVFAILKTSLETLLREIVRYDTTQIDEDLFKEIYQEIVRKEDRHRVGEYYTPEWLAELTFREGLKQHKTNNESEIPSILDPACGSGTFLTNAIHILREELSTEAPSEVLNIILESVVGADINPLAVYIARANYIFALGDLLAYKKDIISIPVYVSDTFQLTEVEKKKGTTQEVFEIDADGKTLSIPSSILIDHSKYREAIKRFERATLTYLEEGRDRSIALIRFGDLTSNFTQVEIEILKETLKTLLDLIDEDRNSIWLFLLSNTLAPMIFKTRKFDMIVGNPPWIAMRFIENISYQEYIKSKIFEYKLIDPSETQLFSNMEMATIFFNNSVNLYLKDGGTIAFVLPRSILTGALHHVRFKGFKHPQLRLIKILDFDKVEPLFNIPSCTILCLKEGETLYPVPLQKYSGTLESKNMRLDKAKHQMKIEDSTYTPPIIEGQKSPYYDKFRMGARLAPRPFWFVDFVSQPILKINPKTPKLKTTEDSRRQAKGEWGKVELQGNVESDHIFSTLLSKDLLPFGYTRMRPVIIPAQPEDEAFELLSITDLQSKGAIHTSNWLKKVEMFWAKYRSAKR